MKSPLIDGISQTGLESYLTARTYGELYWPNFFPIKNVNTLDGKTIIGASGNRVAANVISYNASTPELGRKNLTLKYFDIPKLAIARRKTEKEILEHFITRSVQGNLSVVEDYFNDLDFCFDGVQSRMEWLALTAISTGSVTLSTTNNAEGIISETAIDFGIATAGKKYVTTATWSVANAATMVPITDFKKVVAAGRAAGLKFNYAFMNLTLYDIITGSTEYLNAAKAFVGLTTTDILGVQGVAFTNRILAAMSLPQIVIVDTYVNLESAAGVITSVNPWSDTHILFSPTIQLGNFHAGPIAEELEKPLDVLQSKRGPVLLSVRKEFNPSAVLTKGEANVFPSWTNVDECYSLYTGSISAWA